MRRRSFLTALGTASVFGGCAPDPRPTAMAKVGARAVPRAVPTLKSAELITTDTAAAIYGRHKVEGTRELIRHDVEVYRVEYATHDVDGKEIVASGAVLIPRGAGQVRLMAYCRGTIIPIHGEYATPSYYDLRNDRDIHENYEMSFLAATFASAGYVVVAADGIGYGATKGREHPYVHASSLAWTSLDLLRAGRELAARTRVDLVPRVYITGWSEGGLCGMALHKLIEDTCRSELPVAASSLLAGAYAISSMARLFCSYDEDYPEAAVYYWALRAMCREYKTARPFERTVRPPYAQSLSEDVVAPVPKNPRTVLAPEFRERFLEGREPEMEAALRDNDRHDWKPLAPVYLHHGTHDDIVPFFCAQMAYEAMRRRDGRVVLYPYLGKDHYQPVNCYVTTSLADFGRIP